MLYLNRAKTGTGKQYKQANNNGGIKMKKYGIMCWFEEDIPKYPVSLLNDEKGPVVYSTVEDAQQGIFDECADYEYAFVVELDA